MSIMITEIAGEDIGKTINDKIHSMDTPDGACLLLAAKSTPYVATTPMSFDSGKALILEGDGWPSITWHGTAGKVMFTIANGNTPGTAKIVLRNLRLTDDRVGTVGVGIQIMNSSDHSFQNLYLAGFATGIRLLTAAANQFCETCSFEKVIVKGCGLGVEFTNTTTPVGEPTSYASTAFYNCVISCTGSPDGATGLKIGQNCSLYRSFFGQLVIFANVPNAMGVDCDGILDNASGLIGVENNRGDFGVGGTVVSVSARTPGT